MKALIQKEIRLLAPAWAAAMALATVPFLVFQDIPARELGLAPAFALALGLMFMALTSFGREFSLHTFSVTLTQPVERSVIWRVKTRVLAIAAATTLLVWAFCMWLFAPVSGMAESVMAAALTALIALSSGLWSSLLVRQMVGAFWVALVPPALLFIITTAIPHGGFIFYPALVIYSVAGYKWARSLFFKAQETGWASGLVAAPAFLSFKTGANDRTRTYRPLTALLAKELRLQQPTLMLMIVFVFLHMLALWVRHLTRNWNSYSGFRNTLERAHAIWIMVPLLAGAVSISEERNLGTHGGQLTLPVSARVQFFLKLAVTLFIGGTVSSLLRWFTESLAPGEIFTFKPKEFQEIWLVFTCGTFASFYASSLARNIVQAMAAALVIIPLTIVYFTSLSVGGTSEGRDLWHPAVFLIIGLPMAVLTALWQTISNFRLADNARLWPRNLGVWFVVLLAIPTLSVLVYQRAWELAFTLEPAPGKPMLGSQPGEIVMKSSYSGLTVLLPDGRLWIGKPQKNREPVLFKPKMSRQCAGAFAPGSNWVDVALLGFNHVAALAKDGTLWLAAQERPAKGESMFWRNLHQYGTETNWTQIAGASTSIALLKQDHTLWFWETTNGFLRSEDFQPRQIGVTNTWTRVEETSPLLAFDSAGKAWMMRAPNTKQRDSSSVAALMEPYPLSHPKGWKQLVDFRSAFSSRYGVRTYIVELNQNRKLYGSDSFPLALEQMGSEANWAAINADENSLRALKRDGTLWKLRTRNTLTRGPRKLIDMPWDKTSKRDDWLALSTPCDVITLAADGTLWWWESNGYHFAPHQFLRPSRQPNYLGSIFDQNQAAN